MTRSLPADLVLAPLLYVQGVVFGVADLLPDGLVGGDAVVVERGHVIHRRPPTQLHVQTLG
jgi:hypothetical protein